MFGFIVVGWYSDVGSLAWLELLQQKMGAIRNPLSERFNPESKTGRMEHLLSKLEVVYNKVLLPNCFAYF